MSYYFQTTRDLPNGKRVEHLKNVLCFHFFWKSIFRSFTFFSFVNLYGEELKKKLFDFERLLFLRDHEMLCEGRKEGKKDMKDSDKTRS